MDNSNFDYCEDVGPADGDHLKCNLCGLERVWDKNIRYKHQADCPDNDGGQMMSWDWQGWKDNPARQERERLRKVESEAAKSRPRKPVSQISEDFDSFTRDERTIGGGLQIVVEPGADAPWLTGFGVCLIRVYGIRRTEEGKVEFGIGNESPPILAWVGANAFYDEWPQ